MEESVLSDTIEQYFDSLKPGDKLMIKGRVFGVSGWKKEKFHMQEWVEVFVTKVTRAFYFVGDDKYRKDKFGNMGLGKRHFVPGCNGVPNESNTNEFEIKYSLYCKIIKVNPFFAHKIERLPTIELAAVFAEKFEKFEYELDLAIKSCGPSCAEMVEG